MEQTPHLPIATPSKINRFMITPSFHQSKALMKNPASTVASTTTPRSADRLRICHHFKSHFLHPNRPTRRCQPLPPALLWPAPPPPSVGRTGPGMARILAGFAAPWQAQLAGCCCIPHRCAGERPLQHQINGASAPRCRRRREWAVISSPIPQIMFVVVL